MVPRAALQASFQGAGPLLRLPGRAAPGAAGRVLRA